MNILKCTIILAFICEICLATRSSDYPNVPGRWQQTRFSINTQNIAKNDKRISELQSEVASLKGDITWLNMAGKNLTEEVADLKNEVASLTGKGVNLNTVQETTMTGGKILE
jgi:peptidoglycan hydrolase CwlO-like protein